MKATPIVDFNHKAVKAMTKDQFISQHMIDGKPVTPGIDYAAEYDKIVPPTKVEKEKADKKA